MPEPSSLHDESFHATPGLRLVVAGGGTGGHLFPGIAVAQVFLARNPRNQVLFVNAGRQIETQVLGRLGFPHKVIPIEGIKGRGIWRQIRAALRIPAAVWLSRGFIREFAADAVLGVGGYSAGPVVAAAWLAGIPVALHEQNQLPGVTNRLARHMAARIYLSFEDADRRFDPAKTLLTGNPVRQEIVMMGDRPAREAGGESDPFTILVVGGSQGAHAVNEAVLEALPLLRNRPGLRFIHQTGPQDESMAAEAFAKAGVDATVRAFFQEMAELYAAADLIVCRAGATTVAEITAIGRAALFVPFPFAADDHQTHNAKALVDAGAALMIPQSQLDGRVLASQIVELMADRARISEMAANARSLGRPEAALTIVTDLCRLIMSEKQQPKGGDGLRAAQDTAHGGKRRVT